MKRRDAFDSYHPIVIFTFFVYVVLITMFFNNPFILGISFISSFIYSVMLNGRKALKFNLLFIPMIVLSAGFNVLFNHAGMTILTYFSNGNPLTLESIVYGFVVGTMIVSVIWWFSCYNKIMTSDKFIYIFGSIIPALSLIFSMVLRFVPNYHDRIKKISRAQKCVGRDISDGNIFVRIRNGLKILSIMATWALENGVDTADSMNARGYGLKGRTSYSNFRFDDRDKLVFLIMIVLIIFTVISIFIGSYKMIYFPAIKFNTKNIMPIISYIAFFIFCNIPAFLHIREEKLWKYLESQI